MIAREISLALMAVGSGCSGVSTIIFVYLFIRYVVLRSQTVIEVQDTLKFYMLIEILNGFVVFFSLTHICLIYNIDDPTVYVTPLLFWDAALRNVTVLLRPLALLILGLDKIFIILLPTTAQFKKEIFSFFIGISLMIISTILFSIDRIIPSIPTEIFITNCVSFSCVGKGGNLSLYSIMKTTFGSMDFVLEVILLILLRKKLKVGNFTRIKNKNILLVLLTLFLNVMLNFLPNITGLLFQIVSCYIANSMIK